MTLGSLLILTKAHKSSKWQSQQSPSWQRLSLNDRDPASWACPAPTESSESWLASTSPPQLEHYCQWPVSWGELGCSLGPTLVRQLLFDGMNLYSLGDTEKQGSPSYPTPQTPSEPWIFSTSPPGMLEPQGQFCFSRPLSDYSHLV